MSSEKCGCGEHHYHGSTVSVEAVPGYPLFRVICQQQVDKNDIAPAFQTIMDVLSQPQKRMYVLVDIRQNTELPIKEIVQAAYWGPHRHANLLGWLVVGSHSLAQSIAHLMTQMTRRQNIHWFASEAEALAYIEQNMSGTASTGN